MAFEEIIRFLQLETKDCYFESTESGAELDLLVFKKGRKIGIEDLKLDELNVIIPASTRFKMADNIIVSGLEVFLGCEEFRDFPTGIL